MKRDDDFDWLEQMQRRHREPEPSLQQLAIEGLCLLAVVGGLAVVLGLPW